MNRKPKEITRKDVEKMQERHFRKVWPYYERLQVEWILKDMDRQRSNERPKPTKEG